MWDDLERRLDQVQLEIEHWGAELADEAAVAKLRRVHVAGVAMVTLASPMSIGGAGIRVSRFHPRFAP
jgi:hypothetical protein